ncbi:MAG: type IV secretion system protein [Rickettsiales bacterium]|nr:type IV secretion system protein [Rickettsiales bacterium]
MKLKLLLFTLLFCLLYTNNAHASSMNLLFDISNDIIGLVEGFTMRLYEAVAVSYRQIYFLLCSIILPAVIYSYVKNKINEETVVSFFIAIFLTATIVLNKDNFITFIYKPFFDTLYGFASYIANVSSDNYNSSAGGVETMFGNIYTSSDQLIEILDKMQEKVNISLFSVFKGFAVILTILIIKFLFLFLVSLFVIRFTVAVFSAHIIMIIMPITLSLFPFKSLRPYSFNHIKCLFQYGLTVIFYCISISISAYLIDGIQEIAKSLDGSGENIITYQFLISAIITAGLGYIMLLASNEFASKILNVAGNANILANKAMNRIAAFTAGAGLIQGAGLLAKYGAGDKSSTQDTSSTNQKTPDNSSIKAFQKHQEQVLNSNSNTNSMNLIKSNNATATAKT